ncbi:hypothetical protein ACFLWB_01130 [Chloroflexota bacterium]
MFKRAHATKGTCVRKVYFAQNISPLKLIYEDYTTTINSIKKRIVGSGKIGIWQRTLADVLIADSSVNSVRLLMQRPLFTMPRSMTENMGHLAANLDGLTNETHPHTSPASEVQHFFGRNSWMSSLGMGQQVLALRTTARAKLLKNLANVNLVSVD